LGGGEGGGGREKGGKGKGKRGNKHSAASAPTQTQ